MFDENGDEERPFEWAKPRGLYPLDFWLMVIGVSSLFFVAVVLFTWTADAHEAIPTAAKPLGWDYPWACCSNMDCKEVGATEIREPTTVHPSYEIRATGELIAQGDKRLKDSPDGAFHWCAHQAGLDAGHTICLFVPPKGF